jgi:hypothetical protein
MQIFPLSCYTFPLRSKYLSQTPFSNTFSLCSPLNVRDQVSHPCNRTDVPVKFTTNSLHLLRIKTLLHVSALDCRPRYRCSRRNMCVEYFMFMSKCSSALLPARLHGVSASVYISQESQILHNQYLLFVVMCSCARIEILSSLLVFVCLHFGSVTVWSVSVQGSVCVCVCVYARARACCL